MNKVYERIDGTIDKSQFIGIPMGLNELLKKVYGIDIKMQKSKNGAWWYSVINKIDIVQKDETTKPPKYIFGGERPEPLGEKRGRQTSFAEEKEICLTSILKTALSYRLYSLRGYLASHLSSHMSSHKLYLELPEEVFQNKVNSFILSANLIYKSFGLYRDLKIECFEHNDKWERNKDIYIDMIDNIRNWLHADKQNIMNYLNGCKKNITVKETFLFIQKNERASKPKVTRPDDFLGVNIETLGYDECINNYVKRFRKYFLPPMRIGDCPRNLVKTYNNLEKNNSWKWYIYNNKGANKELQTALHEYYSDKFNVDIPEIELFIPAYEIKIVRNGKYEYLLHKEFNNNYDDNSFDVPRPIDYEYFQAKSKLNAHVVTKLIHKFNELKQGKGVQQIEEDIFYEILTKCVKLEYDNDIIKL